MRDATGRKLPVQKFNDLETPYDNLRRYIKTRRLQSLDEIRAAFDQLRADCWTFRGQADARWYLRTSLERATDPKSDALCRGEQDLLNTFKSRAHQFLGDPPAQDNDLEWLALMQHHGAPTRLLDFTRSPYVALFFAVEKAPIYSRCAVWAINAEGCNERAEHMVRTLKDWHSVGLTEALEQISIDGWMHEAPSMFNKIFLTNQFYLVCSVQPSRVNERMVTQQGIFLCPGRQRFGDGFEINLLNQLSLEKVPEYVAPAWNPPQVYRFIIPTCLRAELLLELERMNINRATLFPGLDGFGQSLAMRLYLRQVRDRKIS
jgi:hypothetical protein